MTGYYGELDGYQQPARIDGWRHRLGQRLRFEVVRRGLDIGGEEAVVDLGCGTGRFCGYLGTERSGRYLGIDRREAAIERGRADFPGGEFLVADLSDGQIDEEGPYDVAVAIGTLVDGGGDDGNEQMVRLPAMIGRLDQLGERAWGLVLLDEKRLRRDPVRRLEPALRGATPGQVKRVLDGRDMEAVVDDEAFPGELFVLWDRQSSPPETRSRIEGDVAHRAIVEGEGEIDDADRAWLWLVTGRYERARQLIDELPANHRRKSLLAQKLRLGDSGADTDVTLES